MRSMSRKFPSPTLRFVALATAAATTACVQTSRSAEAAILECEDLGGLISAFQTVHYSVRRITPEIEARAAEQFVEALDPSRTLLLKGEVDAIVAELTKQFSALREGRCTPLVKAHEKVQARAAEDTKLARKMLSEKFEIDRSVELMVDPEERGYPATEKEREALNRALVHFQMANYLKGGIELEKAKKQLIHRYELTEKRLAERAGEKRQVEMYAEAFARALDPHSAYMSHDTLTDFQISMRLSLEGIGAALRTEDGFTYIESLIPGGGAEKSGKLRPKDKILAVRQEGEEPVSAIDMSIRDVVKLIRGKKGTKVTLTLLREGATTKTFDVTIVRDKIDVAQQAAKLEMKERKVGSKTIPVGVLELPSFYGGAQEDEGRSSYRDMKRLIAEAKEKGAKALVLDLSKNGGGYLEDAVRISGLFLREGAIVSTKDTSGDEEVLMDEDDATDWSGPLVVLVSPMSASASEILAGALHAYGRALVVGAGKSSFGKGSVQTLRGLPRNLGAMKVTTGMYFLPSGSSTQQTGVAVDITVPSVLSTIDVGEKDLDYSLPPQKTKAFRTTSVNGKGKDHWLPVSKTTIASLAAASKTRIERKPEFKEVHEAIEEAKQRKKKLAIAELLEEADDAKEDAKASTKKEDGDGKEKAADEAPDEETTKFERMEAAFVDEAVDIAVDLAAKLKPIAKR